MSREKRTMTQNVQKTMTQKSRALVAKFFATKTRVANFFAYSYKNKSITKHNQKNRRKRRGIHYCSLQMTRLWKQNMDAGENLGPEVFSW